jgi:hypothetical protein
MKSQINTLLLSLILLDLVLSVICLMSPGLWIKLFHGISASDTLGLIRRQGAVWAAFLLFQVIAYFRWPREPFWLVVVAGIRLTEIFSDWVYLFSAEQVTWFGKMGLFIAPPANLLIGWYFIRQYFRIQRSSSDFQRSSER